MNHFSLCPVVFCFHDKQRRVRSASLMIKISKIFELFLQYSKKCTIFTTFTHSHICIFTTFTRFTLNTLLALVPLFVHNDMQVNLHTVDSTGWPKLLNIILAPSAASRLVLLNLFWDLGFSPIFISNKIQPSAQTI